MESPQHNYINSPSSPSSAILSPLQSPISPPYAQPRFHSSPKPTNINTTSSTSASASSSVLQLKKKIKKRDPSSPLAPGQVRVALWDTVTGKKLSGFASPMEKNLQKYLAKHPNCVLYDPSKAQAAKQQQLAGGDKTSGIPAPLPLHAIASTLPASSPTSASTSLSSSSTSFSSSLSRIASISPRASSTSSSSSTTSSLSSSSSLPPPPTLRVLSSSDSVSSSSPTHRRHHRASADEAYEFTKRISSGAAYYTSNKQVATITQPELQQQRQIQQQLNSSSTRTARHLTINTNSNSSNKNQSNIATIPTSSSAAASVSTMPLRRSNSSNSNHIYRHQPTSAASAMIQPQPLHSHLSFRSSESRGYLEDILQSVTQQSQSQHHPYSSITASGLYIPEHSVATTHNIDDYDQNHLSGPSTPLAYHPGRDHHHEFSTTFDLNDRGVGDEPVSPSASSVTQHTRSSHSQHRFGTSSAIGHHSSGGGRTAFDNWPEAEDESLFIEDAYHEPSVSTRKRDESISLFDLDSISSSHQGWDDHRDGFNLMTQQSIHEELPSHVVLQQQVSTFQGQQAQSQQQVGNHLLNPHHRNHQNHHHQVEYSRSHSYSFSETTTTGSTSINHPSASLQSSNILSLSSQPPSPSARSSLLNTHPYSSSSYIQHPTHTHHSSYSQSSSQSSSSASSSSLAAPASVSSSSSSQHLSSKRSRHHWVDSVAVTERGAFQPTQQRITTTCAVSMTAQPIDPSRVVTGVLTAVPAVTLPSHHQHHSQPQHQRSNAISPDLFLRIHPHPPHTAPLSSLPFPSNTDHYSFPSLAIIDVDDENQRHPPHLESVNHDENNSHMYGNENNEEAKTPRVTPDMDELYFLKSDDTTMMQPNQFLNLDGMEM